MKQWIALLLALLTLGLCASPALAAEEAESVPAESSAAVDAEPVEEPAPAPEPAADATPEEPIADDAEPLPMPAVPEEDASAEAEEPDPPASEETPAEPAGATEEPSVETEDPALTKEEDLAPEAEEPAMETEEPAVEVELWDWSEIFSESNDELFAAFVDRELHESSRGGMLRAANRSLYGKLGKFERFVYDAVVPKISAIADGTAEPAEGGYYSTVFTVDLSALFFTAEELGLDAVTDENGAVTQEAKDALTSQLNSFDKYLFGTVLRNDMPYDLYWYDKVTGTVSGSTAWSEFYLNEEGDGISQRRVMSIRFAVADEYAMHDGAGEPIYTEVDFGEGNVRQYCFAMDPAIPGSVSTARTTAQSIVADHAGATDIGKLVAYRDAIRELTEYNNAAASDSATPYGNPWQLIWVFDGDPETKVVCEGYSKAFQYLCDLSAFSSEVRCYSVQGYLGSGAHMWNIVTMPDGWNYLVDVTNDYQYSLFLRGYNSYTVTQLSNGTPTKQYAYARSDGKTLYYTYGKNPATYYGEDLLAMSPDNFGEPGDVNGDGSVDADDLLCLLKHLNGQASVGYVSAFADVTGDGRVNLADLLRLLKKIVLKNDVELHYYGDGDLR